MNQIQRPRHLEINEDAIDLVSSNVIVGQFTCGHKTEMGAHLLEAPFHHTERFVVVGDEQKLKNRWLGHRRNLLLDHRTTTSVLSSHSASTIRRLLLLL